MPTPDDILTSSAELCQALLASQPSPHSRQDRAREVALQCAVTFAAPVPDATENEILGTANIFLPFLLGKDKP